MRKYLTAAATVVTLGFLGLATPAMADQYQQGHSYNGNYGNSDHGGQYQGYGNGSQRSDDGSRRGNRDFDWGRQEGNFDRWENGWNRGGWDNDRHGGALPYYRLVRRVEQQGYYGVRGLRESRHGWGYRAFAYSFRGAPVMLRINPYSGRVIDVRYI